MKKKVFSKSMAWILSLVMIFGVFVAAPATQGNAITQSEFDSALDSLRSQYPDYSTWYDYFDGGHQCYGFARLVAYSVFGSHADDWGSTADISGVKPGDVLQYGNTSGSGHTVFVTAVYGDTIVFVDCNGSGNYSNGEKKRTCGIKWDNMISMSGAMFGKYSFAYRLIAPDIINYHNPIGSFDGVDSPAPNKLHVSGWAMDWDNWGKQLDIHVYVGGPAGSGAPCYVIKANTCRPDVEGVYPGVGAYHGYDATITVGNDRTGNQDIYVYAINVDGGWDNPLLNNSPKTVTIQSIPTNYQDLGTDFYATIITGQSKLVSVDSSANVVQMDIKDSRNQLWHFVRNSDKSYTIINLENGKCLAVQGSGTANCTNVLSQASTGGDNQKWYFVSQGGDFYSLIPKHARNMALDVDGASSAHGAKIQIYEINNTQAQKFRPYKFSAYTISFNLNGGIGSVANQLKVHGQYITIPNVTPTKTGHAFLGWSTDAKATTASIKPNDKYYGTNSSHTLYAVWKANTYTISYNANGGTGTINSSTVTFGQGFTMPNSGFAKAGYTLTGFNAYRTSDNTWVVNDQWVTESQIKDGNTKKLYGTGTWWGLDSSWVNSNASTDTYTFYAVWKINTYTIAYNANGGTGTINSSTVTFGQGFTMPSSGFTKAGYTLTGFNAYRKSDNTWFVPNQGWVTESQIKDGNTKKLYGAGAWWGLDSSWVNSNASTDTYTFYAVWEPAKPSATTVSVVVGNSTTPTLFYWTQTDNTKAYYLKIFKDKLWEGSAFLVKETTDLSCLVELPAGYYEVYVDSVNDAGYTMSANVVNVTVSEAVPKKTGTYNGHIYEFYDQALTWEQAYKFCERKGGHLVTITSKEENDFVVELAKERSGNLWVGGKTSDYEKWYWITGEPFDYQNWATGEPNNINGSQDTIKVYVAGTWDNEIDSQTCGFVCEYDNGVDSEKYLPVIKENYNGHEYWFFEDAVDWQTAKRICEAKGGYLAIPDNADENAFILSGIQKTAKNFAWIGVTDIAQEGTWKDVKGNSPMYTNWANDQPDNWLGTEDYVHLRSDGTWNDGRGFAPMYDPVGFVCEFDDLCTGSGHDYQLTSEKAATCTADGQKVYTCSRCGDTKTEVIKATGHSHTTKVVSPTCTKRGYTVHTCSKCGDSYKDTYVDALGHDYEETVIPPTETEQGYTLHTCKRCGDSYKDNYTDPVPVHLAGDINNDGKVNMKDATRLHQYINGWEVPVVEAALDVNGDGKVNMKDVTRLHQYINGWDVKIYVK